MPVERVLITVKTYPTLSVSYGETVCTAGLREDGSWVRIYPVPFRRLQDLTKRYRKFDWVECNLIPSTTKDKRPESRRLMDTASLCHVGHMDCRDQWTARRTFVLQKCEVFTSLQQLIEDAKANRRSLATFRPASIAEFVVEEDEREWDERKLDEMRKRLEQPELFEDNEWRKTFRIVDKLPYKFSYRFKDDSGQESTLCILDWEIGALYWRYGRECEKTAIAKVRQKYMEQYTATDIHFLLGTTLQWHSVAPNPWVIVGVVPFPRVTEPMSEQLEFPL